MKKIVLYLSAILFSYMTVQAQCGPGEDTEAPVFGNAGDGTMSYPFKNLLSGTVSGVPSGVYYFNFNGSTFQGVLDNDTDGGGWLMVLNYVHLAGDNSDLVVKNTDLPLLGSSTLGDNEAGTANWGHMGNQLAAAIDFEEVRFYAETTGHNRVINFKTSYSNALNYIKTGNGSFSGINIPTNFTTLANHTANIPAQGYNSFSNQGDQALTNFPMYRSGQFHWGIRGLDNRWEVDDFAINTQSTIHRVWARGDLSPTGTITLPVTLDNTGNVTVSPTDFGLAVTDNCGNVNLSLSQTDFTCGEIGNNVVQLTATDDQGNSTSIDVTIVVSESAPIITIQAPFNNLELDANGTATLTLADLNAIATDDCGIQSFTLDKTDFDCSNIGPSVVTLTAIDIHGNTTTNQVVLFVEDNISPVVQCKAPFSIELDPTGTTQISPTDVLESATDNCGINNYSLDKSTFTCADIGDNLVTLTVGDNNGNTATCTTTITLTVPSCPGNLTLESEIDSCGVTYNYPCASNITAGPPSGTFLAVGSTTTFTYDTLDNTGATVSCSYDVTVVDTQGPIFTTADQTLTLAADGTASLTANDLLGSHPLAIDYTIDQTGTLDRVDIASSGTQITLTDDEVSAPLPIGFEFAFYGNLYDTFYIGSNGFMTFTGGGDDGCCNGQTIPEANSPDNLIAFDWDDLNPEDGGTIRYETIGIAPNRILIMDFDNVAHIDDPDLGTTVQVKLFETTNRIEIHSTNIYDLGNDKTQGLENIDGTAAIVVPGRNAAQWEVSNDYIAFIPVPGIIDGCGVASLVASQTTFDCASLGANTITVTATDNNGNIVEKDVIVTIEDPLGVCVVLVEPKVYLQGAYMNPIMGEENLMRDDLRVNGLIPTTSLYPDGATCDATVFNVTGADAIVDWVWIELRDATDNGNVIDAISGLLQRDGDVVAVDGVSPLTFTLGTDNYYVTINHRNHLGIMSSNPIALSPTTTVVDLTTSSGDVLGGNNAVTLLGGKYTMYGGDFNADGQVLNTDIQLAIQLAGTSGYSLGDADMDGQILNTDIQNVMRPNAGKGQQYPN